MVNKRNLNCIYLEVLEHDNSYTRWYCKKEKEEIDDCLSCQFYHYADTNQEDMEKYLKSIGF